MFLAKRGWAAWCNCIGLCKQTGSAECVVGDWINREIGIEYTQTKGKGIVGLIHHIIIWPNHYHRHYHYWQ